MLLRAAAVRLLFDSTVAYVNAKNWTGWAGLFSDSATFEPPVHLRPLGGCRGEFQFRPAAAAARRPAEEEVTGRSPSDARSAESSTDCPNESKSARPWTKIVVGSASPYMLSGRASPPRRITVVNWPSLIALVTVMERASRSDEKKRTAK
jgi:hypothetical protein